MGITIITIALVYGALVMALVVLQRKLMYKPVPGNIIPAFYGLAHFHDVELKSEDNTKLQLWYREANQDMPTVVYFHGNAGNLGDRAPFFAALAERGFGVAAVSYRGYGKSKGTPTENGIYADARSAIKWVRSQGIPISDMAFYGESLGTGVAVKMATEFTPRGVFLQAPYTSVVARASEIYWYIPVKHLLLDHFDSFSLIRKVKSPVMIFHGNMDDVIPPHHGQTLFASANDPKHIHLFDNIGHTDFDNHLLSRHVQDAMR